MPESHVTRVANQLRQVDPDASLVARVHYALLQEELSLLYRLIEPLTTRWSPGTRRIIEESLATMDHWRAQDIYTQRAISGTIRNAAREVIGAITLDNALDS